MRSDQELSLTPQDAARFAQVVQAFLQASGRTALSQDDYLTLHDLVARHGVAATLKAIAEAQTLSRHGPLRPGHISAILEQRDPLLAQVMALYSQEIEPGQPITPLVREQLIALVDEFPYLEWWQEAIRRAVKCGRRRLSTVERILRDYQETGSWERKTQRVTHVTTHKPARRPPSRETKYDEETLRRIREADKGADWSLPPDVF